MNALPSYCGRDGCTCQSCKTNMKPPKWSDIFVCLRSLRVGVASNKTDVQTNTCIKYLLWVSPQTIFDFVRCETTSPRTRSTCEWDRFRSSLNVLAALCAPKTQQDRRPSLIHPTEWNHYMPFDQKKWCISIWINMSAMGWLATKTVVYWFETNGLREAMVHNPIDGNVWQFPPTENHTRWWFDQARLYVRWNERGMVTPVWRTWCFWCHEHIVNMFLHRGCGDPHIMSTMLQNHEIMWPQFIDCVASKTTTKMRVWQSSASRRPVVAQSSPQSSASRRLGIVVHSTFFLFN